MQATQAGGGGEQSRRVSLTLTPTLTLTLTLTLSSLLYGLTTFDADISGWDTSSVTTMNQMFRVRSARALGPQALSQAIPVHAALVVCRHHTPGPPASRLAPLPPASHALPSTRQRASAFNQPLSFDTSSVTDMRSMFGVRSARALGPQALSRAFFPCMPLVVPPPHPGPSRLPARTSPPRIACPPFDSAVRVGLQPAAEL
jgi:hypothetical protein